MNTSGTSHHVMCIVTTKEGDKGKGDMTGMTRDGRTEKTDKGDTNSVEEREKSVSYFIKYSCKNSIVISLPPNQRTDD